MSQARGPRRSKAIEKRQRILDATAEVMVAAGSTEFPLQDVARRVGIYTASIYYYFESREVLISEVLLSSITKFRDQLVDSVASLPADASALDRLAQAIRKAVQLNTSLNDYMRAYTFVFGQPSELLDEQIRARRQEIRRFWARLLKEAHEAGEIDPSIDLDLLRYIIVGAAQWIAFWYRPEGPLKTDYVADTYVNVLLHGCVAKPSQAGVAGSRRRQKSAKAPAAAAVAKAPTGPI